MKRYTAKDAKNNLGQLMDAAQREPVVIEKHGRPTVVVMSAAQYKLEQERRAKLLRYELARGEASGIAESFSWEELEAALDAELNNKDNDAQEYTAA